MQKDCLNTTEVQFANADLLPEVVTLLNEGHTVTLRLRGFSMRPFLEDNRDKALLIKPQRLMLATRFSVKLPHFTSSYTG